MAIHGSEIYNSLLQTLLLLIHLSEIGFMKSHNFSWSLIFVYNFTQNTCTPAIGTTSFEASIQCAMLEQINK